MFLMTTMMYFIFKLYNTLLYFACQIHPLKRTLANFKTLYISQKYCILYLNTFSVFYPALLNTIYKCHLHKQPIHTPDCLITSRLNRLH